MEWGTDINATRVDKVYRAVEDAVNAGKTISAQAELVYQVEMLSQEVNSGASFEQYFRWARMTDNSRILQYLQDLALPEVRGIVERAVAAAFPIGIPEDDDDYELCMDWSKDQEQLLAELFGEFEIYNGAITNKLGQFIGQNKVAVLAPAEAGSDEAEASPQDVDPRTILAELGQLRDPDNLTEIQRNVWLAWRFECGISNGGIWRHFMDSESLKITQPHFVGALRHLGAKEHAVILEQAVARMPHDLSMSEAFDLLLEEGDVSDLEDLDATLIGCGSRLVDLLQHYLLQHIADFIDFVK